MSAKPMDSFCYELAERFLPEPHTEACVEELAECFRNFAAGFVSTHVCRSLYTCPWCSETCEREQERRVNALTRRTECGCCGGCEDARRAALKEDGEMDKADGRYGE